MGAQFDTLEEYVAEQAPEIRDLLDRLRILARDAIPGGVEAISYQIPTIKRDGVNVVHFAAWKRHLSIYPIPEVDPDRDRVLVAAMAPYVAHKGTLRFKYDEALPEELIRQVMSRLAAADRNASGKQAPSSEHGK
jgi:uncharacterized protein YdhG (YjbR/CyaY superfamily)